MDSSSQSCEVISKFSFSAIKILLKSCGCPGVAMLAMPAIPPIAAISFAPAPAANEIVCSIKFARSNDTNQKPCSNKNKFTVIVSQNQGEDAAKTK